MNARGYRTGRDCVHALRRTGHRTPDAHPAPCRRTRDRHANTATALHSGIAEQQPSTSLVPRATKTALCETSLGLTPREKFVFSRWFLVEIAASELFWCAAPAHLPRSRPASAESRRAWHGPGPLPSPPVARAPAEPQSWGDCGTLIRAGGAAQHAGKSPPGSAHAREARPHRP